MIVYRELLKKYIEWVGQQEGIDFLGASPRHCAGQFTEDEWAELMRLSDETRIPYAEVRDRT